MLLWGRQRKIKTPSFTENKSAPDYDHNNNNIFYIYGISFLSTSHVILSENLSEYLCGII